MIRRLAGTNKRPRNLGCDSIACATGAAFFLRLCASGVALRIGALGLFCALLFGAPLAAQTPPAATQNNPAAADPIKCWWRTDKSAVEVGEQFRLTLTCGVGAMIAPKMEQLDPGALQMAPFDVVSGTRQEDIQAPPWRYVQFEYTLRLIGQDYFGKDAEIPSLTVTYNVQSDVAGASEGRDKMYVLPAIPIRVLSLVPQKANDIRDSTGESFAAAKARLAHASSEFIAAGILFGFGILMLAFAVVRAIGGLRERQPGRTSALPEGMITRACLQELGRLESEVALKGWTPERAGSALTVFRIGSAVALAEPLAQGPLDKAAAVREGQLAVRKGLLNQERVVVSAATTADAIDRYRATNNGHATDGRSLMIADLGQSLSAFSAARYGRNGNNGTAKLDTALQTGRDALRQLHRTTLWPARTAGMITESVKTIRSSMWTR